MLPTRRLALALVRDHFGSGSARTDQSRLEQLHNSSYLPNVARLRLAFARATRTALTANQQYVAGVIGLDTFGDIASDGPVCAGCCQSILLVLQQVWLQQEVGAPGGDDFYLTAPGTRQYVWWQQVPECPVPARRALWGSIKTTYR